MALNQPEINGNHFELLTDLQVKWVFTNYMLRLSHLIGERFRELACQLNQVFLHNCGNLIEPIELGKSDVFKKIVKELETATDTLNGTFFI